MILKINDRIRNRQVAYFDKIDIDLKYDSVASTFQLGYYFDPNNNEHKELSCIGHYHICELIATAEDGVVPNQLLMRGVILSIRMKSSAKKNLVAISGYSLPGILEDCEIPPKAPENPGYTPQNMGYFPVTKVSLQSDQLSLREIAQKYLSPFGLNMRIHSSVAADMESKFEQTNAKESQSVKSYLSDLASQRNIVITHDAEGNVVFTRANSRQKPVFHFENGIPSVEMDLEFNGQAMHSHIYVYQDDTESDVDASSIEPTLNPYVPFVFRPKIVTQSSKKDISTQDSALSMICKEVRNMSLTIQMDRWALDGKIVKPGQIITVTQPEIFLYDRSKWIVESVSLKKDPTKDTSTLKCVIPEAFTGEIPKYIFQGYNLHAKG